MKKPRWPNPKGDDRDVRLDIDVQGESVMVTLSAAGSRLRLPLTPSEARQVAGHLLLNARSVDPNGHDDAVKAIEQSARLQG